MLEISRCHSCLSWTLLSEALILQKRTNFISVPILAESHRELNSSEKSFFCCEISFVFDGECINEIASQGVIGCKKISSRKGTKVVSMVLTFALHRSPERVNASCNICNAIPYILLSKVKKELKVLLPSSSPGPLYYSCSLASRVVDPNSKPLNKMQATSLPKRTPPR